MDGNHHSKVSMTSLDQRRQPSQLAMAGSMNINSTKGNAPALLAASNGVADEERLKKVM